MNGKSSLGVEANLCYAKNWVRVVGYPLRAKGRSAEFFLTLITAESSGLSVLCFNGTSYRSHYIFKCTIYAMKFHQEVGWSTWKQLYQPI